MDYVSNGGLSLFHSDGVLTVQPWCYYLSRLVLCTLRERVVNCKSESQDVVFSVSASCNRRWGVCTVSRTQIFLKPILYPCNCSECRFYTNKNILMSPLNTVICMHMLVIKMYHGCHSFRQNSCYFYCYCNPENISIDIYFKDACIIN